VVEVMLKDCVEVTVVELVVDSAPAESVVVLVLPLEVDVVVATSTAEGYWAVKTFPVRVRTLISTSPCPV
jgi:hypothetical protein